MWALSHNVDMFPVSAIALIIANLIPVFGVAFQGWSLFAIMLLYWLESAVTGVFNVLRMRKVGGVESGFMAPFFMLHYGIFMFVHLIFVIVFFGVIGGGWRELQLGLLVPILSLVASHAVSYYSNFIGKQEYLRTSLGELMMRPYGRIIVMHITIIVGGSVIMSLGSPTGVIILMMAVKTLIDLVSHLVEHRILPWSNSAKMVLYINGKEIDTHPQRVEQKIVS